LIRLPKLSDRLVSCGRTGSGKTVGGLWHLSNFNVGIFPWILVDFKNDENIDEIENVQDVGFDFLPGKKDVGLFRLRCTPYDVEGSTKERSKLDSLLIRVWQRGDCGLFIDEAYIIGNSEALNLCYTQGRSLRIPMITNTQRPVWCSRFAFSEASFIQCYDLTDYGDIGRVEEFIPLDWDDQLPLQKYQSFYYDVAEKKLARLNPVPPMKEIAAVFAEKLPQRRVWL
jgi:hypothetical protein